jgi:hypothetical protein
MCILALSCFHKQWNFIFSRPQIPMVEKLWPNVTHSSDNLLYKIYYDPYISQNEIQCKYNRNSEAFSRKNVYRGEANGVIHCKSTSVD